jgi:ribosomal protein S18 acetylase RimI-like enzyme
MPGDIEIRPVREHELAMAGEATARAYREFAAGGSPGWEAYFARIADVAGRAGRATVLVVLVEGVIAGSATLEVDSRMNPDSSPPLAGNEAHLRMLGIAPEFRRHGIARALVIACIDVARDRGKRRLTLDTSPAMTAAQHLYSTMGFVPTGEHSTPDGVRLLGYTLDIESQAGATR